jgi:signal transduction histidine kinase
MLHNFITTNRDLITARATVLSRRRDARVHPESPTKQIETFLAHVSATLSEGGNANAANTESLTCAAGLNGANMLRAGHPIVDVVQSYGDVCQAVTALAAESHVPISAGDFCIFNRCLDDAIGHAVSEYNRIRAEKQSIGELQRLAVAAHELRDHLQTATLSLRALKLSGGPVDGVSGVMLERALVNLTQLVDRTLSDVRLAAGVDRRDTFALAPFLHEVASIAVLHADSRGLKFRIDSNVAAALEGDRQLLMSAVMNLVHNALKFTKPGGEIVLTARTTAARLTISVQDECGGLPDGAAAVFSTFTDRRGADRSGLGLGLSIVKKIIRAHGGEIAVRDNPGTGCVFTIDMPLVAVKFRRARPRRAAGNSRMPQAAAAVAPNGSAL